MNKEQDMPQPKKKYELVIALIPLGLGPKNTLYGQETCYNTASFHLGPKVPRLAHFLAVLRDTLILRIDLVPFKLLLLSVVMSGCYINGSVDWQP